MTPTQAEIRDIRPGSASDGEEGSSDNVPLAPAAAWSRASSAVHSAFGGGISILNLDTGRYFRLEGVGAQIWNALARPVTVDAIAAVIVADYSIDPATTAETIAGFVDSLRGAGLVVAS